MTTAREPSALAVTADFAGIRTLLSRQVIAHAHGVIMGRGDDSGDSAHAVFRRSALRDGGLLREQAEKVVASTRRPEPGPGQAPAAGRHG